MQKFEGTQRGEEMDWSERSQEDLKQVGLLTAAAG